MTTGTLTSTRVIGERGTNTERTAESSVSRAGEIVSVDLINQRGDRLRATLDHEGHLYVEAEQGGRTTVLYGATREATR